MCKKIKSIVQKIKQDKSFRKKYIYYYGLTFAFPIIFILLANLITQQIVREQVLRSNERTLKQFFGFVDGKIESMVGTAYDIVLNQEIQEYARFDAKEAVEKTYKKVNLLGVLKEYCSTDGYKDVFVWFPHSGRVLSGMNPMAESSGLTEYCTSYYMDEDALELRIQEMLNRDSVSPLFYSVNIDKYKQYFSLSLNRFRKSSKIQNYILTLVMDCSFMDNWIGEGVLGEGEDALLFSESGELLYSYRKTGMEVLPEAYRDTGVYEVEKEGELYTFLVQESKTMGGYYAVEISQDVFFEPLSRVRVISIATIFISFFVGAFVIYRMSCNTYQPLELILTQLQKETEQKFDSNRQNEFEFIAELLKKKEDNKKLDHSRKRREREEERKKALLFATLEGREVSDGEIQYLESCMVGSEKFFGGILLLKQCGKVGWDLLPFVVTNIFEELFAEKCKCDILSFSGSRHVILVSFTKEENYEELEKLVETGINFLQQYFGIRALFGEGDISNDVWGLHNLYREAQQALEYSFLQEDETIIHFKDIKGRQMKLPFVDENPVYYIINDFLKKEKVQVNTARIFLDEMLQTYGINENASMETVSYFRYEMINALNRVWANSNEEYFKRQSYVKELTDAESLRKYVTCLEKILFETGKLFQYNRRRTGIAEQVKQYVDQNYFNPELSVTFIGKHFCMQGAYLAKIFREEYDVLMLNYISSVRITHVKKMLKESDLSINDIAERTGFLSGDVMIKSFKKLVGITPGKYRTAENVDDSVDII